MISYEYTVYTRKLSGFYGFVSWGYQFHWFIIFPSGIPKSCHVYRVYHEQTQDHPEARGFFKKGPPDQPTKIRLVRWWFFEVWANCFAAGYVDEKIHRTTIANRTRLNYPLWVLLPTGTRKNLLPSIRRSYRVLEVNTPNPGQTLTQQPGQHLTTG